MKIVLNLINCKKTFYDFFSKSNIYFSNNVFQFEMAQFKIEQTDQSFIQQHMPITFSIDDRDSTKNYVISVVFNFQFS